MYINENNEQKTRRNLNNGSLCQVTKVEKIIGYCNQFNNGYDTAIEPGIEITIMEDDRLMSWDIINKNYTNDWDTIITCYAREVSSTHYKDEFEEYTEKNYIITRVIDIDQERYIQKVLDDIAWRNELSDGIYRKTPLSYQTKIDKIEELEDIEDLVEGCEY